MCAFGCAVMVCVPICFSRVLFEVVSTRGTYGMLVPMNNNVRCLFIISMHHMDQKLLSYIMLMVVCIGIRMKILEMVC